MSRRRLLILVVVLAALTGLAASIAPRQAADPPGRPAPVAGTSNPGEAQLGPRNAPATDVAEVTDIPSEPPLRQLDAAGNRQVVEVEAGQRARLTVSGNDLVSIQVGTDGPIESVDPDAPARFDLLYTTPMRLAIRRLDTGRPIGELRVLPADG